MDDQRDTSGAHGGPAARRIDARDAFARVVAASLASPPARSRRPPTWQSTMSLLLSLALAAGLAATGGISYAASSLRVMSRTAAAPHAAIVLRGLTAGGDQYAPGYSFGDPDHNHPGPPGVTVDDAKAAADAPLPAAPTPDSLAQVVGASVSFDEQVHLYISVVDPRNTPLLLTQSSKRGGSKVGAGLTGPQTKFIQYAVLIPRTIPIQLRVPANLLDPRLTYTIRIVAIDPQGNRSRLLIPFRA